MGPWALKTHCLRPIIPKDWRGALFYQNTQAWSFPPLAHDVLLDGNATEKDIFGKWCPAENHYSIRIRLIGVVSSNSFVQRQGELIFLHQFSSVPSLSRVQLSETPWTAAHQASLSITNSQSLPKLIAIESVMPSNHLILWRPLLLLPSIFPSIRVVANEAALHIRWPKYWSFSFNISPSMDTQDYSPLGWTGWISLQSKGLSRVFSNTTLQKHQFFGIQLSSQCNSDIHTWLQEKP